MFAACVLLLLPNIFSYGAASSVLIGTVERLLESTDGHGACAEEVELGDSAADALRTFSDADVAVLPGVLFQGDLAGGDLLLSDLERVFPDDAELASAELTAAEIYELLELSISTFTVDTEYDAIDYEASAWDGFLQMSGLIVRYDVSAPQGERVYSLTLSDGTELDRDDAESVYLVASSVELLSGGYGYPEQDWSALDITLREVMVWYTDYSDGVLPYPDDGRITMIGTVDQSIIGGEYGTFIVLICILLIVFFVLKAVNKNSLLWQQLMDHASPEVIPEEERRSWYDDR